MWELVARSSVSLRIVGPTFAPRHLAQLLDRTGQMSQHQIEVTDVSRSPTGGIKHVKTQERCSGPKQQPCGRQPRMEFDNGYAGS